MHRIVASRVKPPGLRTPKQTKQAWPCPFHHGLKLFKIALGFKWLLSTINKFLQAQKIYIMISNFWPVPKPGLTITDKPPYNSREISKNPTQKPNSRIFPWAKPRCSIHKVSDICGIGGGWQGRTRRMGISLNVFLDFGSVVLLVQRRWDGTIIPTQMEKKDGLPNPKIFCFKKKLRKSGLICKKHKKLRILGCIPKTWQFSGKFITSQMRNTTTSPSTRRFGQLEILVEDETVEMLETHLPTINVQVRTVSFREGILTGICIH